MTLSAWLDQHFPEHAELVSGEAAIVAGRGPAPDTDRDRALAWRIHVELRTRVATQALGLRSGDDVAALGSLGDFFKLAREAVAQAGPCGSSELVVLLLNDTLRPFTSHWHREAERRRLSRDDRRRLFRVELDLIRTRLCWWDALFRHVADGSPVGPLPALDRESEPPEPRTAGPETLPHRAVADDEEARLPTGLRKQFAIAFSGGGIRSASFCLGVMMGLSRTRIYEDADFVSAVSGGGYLVTLLRSARENAPGLGRNPLRSPTVGGAAKVGYAARAGAVAGVRGGEPVLTTRGSAAEELANLFASGGGPAPGEPRRGEPGGASAASDAQKQRADPGAHARIGEPPLLSQVRARTNSMWDRWPVAVLRVGLAWALSAGALAWLWAAAVFLWRCRGFLPGLSAELGEAPDFSDTRLWIGAGVWALAPLLPALDSCSPAAFYLAYLERIWVVGPSSVAARMAAVTGGGETSPARQPIFLRTAAHNRGERPFGTDTYDAERLADVATFSGGHIDVGGSRPEALPHGISDVDAMAICGAAVAPSLGIATKWWLRPLLALVGARLGRWIRVKEPAVWRSGPPLYLFLCEMFGLPDPSGRFRYFSDGGHIENLGVYPLLRRRVRYILAIDGEADPTMAFDGLRQLQRLARIDLGVELEIDTTDLDPGEDGLSDNHITVIKIRYPEIVGGGDGEDRSQPATEGVLVYVKSSMTGDEPSHVLGYRQTHPDFPHESTMIQWFNERQFEAYRALGEHVGRQLVSAEWLGPSPPRAEDLDGPTWVGRIRSRVERA